MKNEKKQLSTLEIKTFRKQELGAFTSYINTEIAKIANRARKRKFKGKEVVVPHKQAKYLADAGYKWGEYCTLTDATIFEKMLKARADLRKALEKCKTPEQFRAVRDTYTAKSKDSYSTARADGAIKRVTVAIAKNNK